MQDRRVVLSLPPDLYRQIEEAARAEDRIVEQQIRAILRRCLELPEMDGQRELEKQPQ
jgi:hypothetical protein